MRRVTTGSATQSSLPIRRILEGFVFDGRLNEDFKLSSGTWVRVGPLRMRLLAHFGILVQDAVIAGPTGNLWPRYFSGLEICRKLCAGLAPNAPAHEVLRGPDSRSVSGAARFFRFANTGSSTHIERAILLDIPPSMEAREIRTRVP